MTSKQRIRENSVSQAKIALRASSRQHTNKANDTNNNMSIQSNDDNIVTISKITLNHNLIFDCLFCGFDCVVPLILIDFRVFLIAVLCRCLLL